MTNQEIFNAVYLGLKSQGFERSLRSEGYCTYRGDNGRKCAVGWLIPDENYSPAIEGDSALDRSVQECLPAELKGKTQFLNKLQVVHDDGLDPGLMQTYLLDFAENYGLTIPEEK